MAQEKTCRHLVVDQNIRIKTQKLGDVFREGWQCILPSNEREHGVDGC